MPRSAPHWVNPKGEITKDALRAWLDDQSERALASRLLASNSHNLPEFARQLKKNLPNVAIKLPVDISEQEEWIDGRTDLTLERQPDGSLEVTISRLPEGQSHEKAEQHGAMLLDAKKVELTAKAAPPRPEASYIAAPAKVHREHVRIIAERDAELLAAARRQLAA
jgi:hypothetical protein